MSRVLAHRLADEVWYFSCGCFLTAELVGFNFYGSRAGDGTLIAEETAFGLPGVQWANIQFSVEGKAPSSFGKSSSGETPAAIGKKNVFEKAVSGFTIHYYKDSTGFTLPEWNGYPAVEVDAPAPAKSATALLTWTSSDGKAIQAKCIKLDGEAVVVEKDGKPFTVPFTKLAPESVTQAKKLGAPRLRQPKHPQGNLSLAPDGNDFLARPSVKLGIPPQPHGNGAALPRTNAGRRATPCRDDARET